MAKKSSQKRDLVKPKGDARYAKRKSDGTFTEMDDVRRSQKADRKTKAKTAVKPGYGDRGDQRTASRKRAAKKR
jgi:hypothetical protein